MFSHICNIFVIEELRITEEENDAFRLLRHFQIILLNRLNLL